MTKPPSNVPFVTTMERKTPVGAVDFYDTAFHNTPIEHLDCEEISDYLVALVKVSPDDYIGNGTSGGIYRYDARERESTHSSPSFVGQQGHSAVLLLLH